jgi:L-ascorbate 6-phosphate lactonase
MIEEIRGIQLKRGETAISWLGQNFFILKTPDGNLIAIDPYMERRSEIRYVHPEPPIKPEDLDVNYVFCTHDHRDHTDPVSLPIVARSHGQTVFIGPRESADRLISLGIEEKRVKALEAHVTYDFGSFHVTPYYSVSPEEAGTTHLGYPFKIGGVKIYNLGDTSRSAVENAEKFFREVAEESPDIAMFPIIGDTPDRRPEDAYKLARAIRPKIVIPCHYDCFADRTIDPERFIRLFEGEKEIQPIVIQYKGTYIYRAAEDKEPPKPQKNKGS